MDKYEEVERHRRETDHQRIAVTDNVIDLAMTRLVRADTQLSMGNPARADDLIAKARRAHENAAKFLVRVTDPEQRHRLNDKHQALIEAIREVERKRRHQHQNP